MTEEEAIKEAIARGYNRIGSLIDNEFRVTGDVRFQVDTDDDGEVYSIILFGEIHDEEANYYFEEEDDSIIIYAHEEWYPIELSKELSYNLF